MCMTDVIQNKNITFTARSPKIKDAQWIARKVRSIPHVSTTRIDAPMWDLKEQNIVLYDRFMNKRSFEHFVVKNDYEAKIIKLFMWQRKLIRRLQNLREEWGIGRKDDYRRVSNVLGQFKYGKIGNCGEDSFLSAAIAKINGINNVYTAKLKVDDSEIDHVVCIFNSDGSRFDGHVKKDTIIVDSWIGEADFAKNMFVKYKNLCKKFFFSLESNSKISFKDVTPVDLSEEEQKVLLNKYDCFQYSSSSRNFMQKKN